MRSLVAVFVLLTTAAQAATVVVAEGESIQAVIAAAVDGDTIAVGPGTFVEDLDFLGKAIVVRGTGAATVVRGTGTTSVVRFASGEGPGSVLDGLTVTGGVAERGGGIAVVGASPTIVRTTVVGNRAVTEGSGVYLEASAARLYNNLIAWNASAGGDPHSVQIRDGAPRLVNNTIVRGDSNGVLVRGTALPILVNNILAYNGSRPTGFEARGRGLCDFGPATVIRWNLFYRNRRAALLTADGTDYRRVRAAERALGDPRLANNLDRSPRFVSPARSDFRLRPTSAAVRAGDPDPAFANLDGSRNTIGHLGGPYAMPSMLLP
jgi:hypothetical protein